MKTSKAVSQGLTMGGTVGDATDTLPSVIKQEAPQYKTVIKQEAPPYQKFKHNPSLLKKTTYFFLFFKFFLLSLLFGKIPSLINSIILNTLICS